MGRPLPLAVIDDAPGIDRRGRRLHDLRISVIDRCNFRCPYCMPEERYPRDARFMPAQERLAPGEIESLARAFVALGVRKLRLTGGEPLLRRDIGEIVERLASIEAIEDLALTTNGVRLEALAATLRGAGLRRLTVSLDALDGETFARMSGGKGRIEDVLAGIEAAQAAGFARIKFNAVIQRGVNEHAVLDLATRYRDTPHVVRFIEYMDVGTCNGWSADQVVPAREMRDAIHARWPLVPLAASYRGEVAERYAYADGRGEIGFVASVSAPFCGDCHRARLSADGRLYTCLFAAQGHDLRTALRAGASQRDLERLIGGVWGARTDRYSEERAEAGSQATRRVEMYRIGG